MSDQETVQLIALEKLQPFKNYPFIVRDDEQMKIITDSVRNVGILTPAIEIGPAVGRPQEGMGSVI